MRTRNRVLGAVVLGTWLAVLAHAGGGPEEALRTLLDGKRPLEDVVITYDVGNEYFDGRTLLTVLGEGLVQLDHFKAGEKKHFEKALTTESVQMILKRMLNDRFWMAKAEPKEFPEPDTAQVILRFNTKQEDVDCSVSMPVEETHTSKELQKIVAVLRSLIRAVSDGEVQY
ncbi:MAG: hypothetical protein KKC51_03505 [Verrucomicrobia bacterium]|nr:hypothetical protein [Verrucomicrobiota bacterium]